jgi:TNF receptor-associated factor 2
VLHSYYCCTGPYDALLRWPFQQKVTLTIIDQAGNNHVVDAFQPDTASSSFKRPTSDMHIASGCPLFMPLSYLEMKDRNYVKDDCMFVKVVVDTRDLNV